MILHRVLPVENYSIVGKFIQTNEKLKDHMWETGHSCRDSNCPICGKQFHSGGYHPADQKLYHHMREKDECHRQRARRMNWKISSWSHDMCHESYGFNISKKAQPRDRHRLALSPFIN